MISMADTKVTKAQDALQQIRRLSPAGPGIARTQAVGTLGSSRCPDLPRNWWMEWFYHGLPIFWKLV
jgi:hypothetical protein